LKCSIKMKRKKLLLSSKRVKWRMKIKLSKSEKKSEEKENSKTKKLIKSSSQIEKWITKT